MYEVTAYDKDNDDYDVVYTTDDIEKAEFYGGLLNRLIREDRVRTLEGEPYDWLEIYKNDDGMCELVKQYQ